MSSSSIPQHSYYPVYQPLFLLQNHQPTGYEALLRNKNGLSPEFIFRQTRQENHLYELDTFSAKTAIETFAEQTRGKDDTSLLFINFFPSTILHPDFPQFLRNTTRASAISNNRIVLEINESKEEEAIWDLESLETSLQQLREEGFRYALDDVGKGAASLAKIIQCEPDYLKLDRFFSSGLSSCPKKQQVVSLFVQYCRDRSQLVLEGIEKKEDLEMAKSLGVPLGQGFFLGMPGRL